VKEPLLAAEITKKKQIIGATRTPGGFRGRPHRRGEDGSDLQKKGERKRSARCIGKNGNAAKKPGESIDLSLLK